MAKKLHRRFIKLDDRAIQMMVDLFTFVNTLGKTPDLALRGGVYRQIADAEVHTQSFDGWEVGYKIEDLGMVWRRKIFLKCEQPLAEIPEDQKNPVMAAVFEVFLEKGQGPPEIEQISEFCVLVAQDVMPLLMTEMNPNLVSKGPLIH